MYNTSNNSNNDSNTNNTNNSIHNLLGARPRARRRPGVVLLIVVYCVYC